MNKEVREYLIAVARQDESTVFYKELVSDNRLKINLDTPEGRDELKQLLSDISTYEHQHNRPMLTAMAIHKSDKDQGAGFYELAEKFGYGKKTELRKNGWGRKEAERVRAYWKNEDHYNQFASTEVKKTLPNKIAKLFDTLVNSEEYTWAIDWKNRYVDFVLDVKRLQRQIETNPDLAIDNKKLYAPLSKPIQSYGTFMAKWLKEMSNGISSRGQSVMSGDDFNTVIADAGFKVIAKLVISNPTTKTFKLLEDWWYSNEAIANRPLLINRAVAACLPEKLSSTVDNKKFWYVVDVLQRYGFKLPEQEWNWFSANMQLTEWLDQQLQEALPKVSSDLLEQQVWRNIFVWLVYEKYHGKPSIAPNQLIKRDPPEDGYSEMPEGKAGFEGSDIDFEKQAKVQKELGDAGEELVKLHEIRELEKRGMKEKAALVRIAKPGEGYDVYSFDENGKEKFIEVKTTTGKGLNRFHLTRHEIKFMRDRKDNYALYRVYNFDEENNSGEFFELSGDIERLTIMEPTQFEVVIRKK